MTMPAALDPTETGDLSGAPADGSTAGLWVSGRQKWVLLASMGTVFFILLTLYASVLGVLLPNQIQNIDPVGKASTLGVIYAITSVFSTLTTPVAGALSDRTRSRFGRRTPWIVLGGVIGGGAIIAVPHMPGLVGITLIWLVAAVSLNAMQPAITTLVADRFSPEERGLASGVVGGAMTAGVSFGTFSPARWPTGFRSLMPSSAAPSSSPALASSSSILNRVCAWAPPRPFNCAASSGASGSLRANIPISLGPSWAASRSTWAIRRS